MGWWRRTALAVLDSERGFTAVVLVLAFACLSPVFIFGIWWLLGIVVVGFSFLAGYGFARREWRKKGYVPRI